jgi:Fe2+ transport system protein B
MTDALNKGGSKINVENLSQFLGNIPIVFTAANKGRGISDLIGKAIHAAHKN